MPGSLSLVLTPHTPSNFNGEFISRGHSYRRPNGELEGIARHEPAAMRSIKQSWNMINKISGTDGGDNVK